MGGDFFDGHVVIIIGVHSCGLMNVGQKSVFVFPCSAMLVIGFYVQDVVVLEVVA